MTDHVHNVHRAISRVTTNACALDRNVHSTYFDNFFPTKENLVGLDWGGVTVCVCVAKCIYMYDIFCSLICLESLTSMTSDGSALEERIRLLKKQLQQKKEEMKKFQNEQKRKKKAVLRQQEEQLKKKLEVRVCWRKVLPTLVRSGRLQPPLSHFYHHSGLFHHHSQSVKVLKCNTLMKFNNTFSEV